MTVQAKVGLLILSLALANLAIWGLRQLEAHAWLNELARALG
jgi:hypothetical protein